MSSTPLALIIEDEYDVSIIFSKALEEAGFATEIISTGDEALTRLSSTTPDLVVLDLNLPHVTGQDILRQMRSDPRLADVSVIIATAYPHMAEGLHDQADWTFFKPVSFTQLRDLAIRLGARVTPGEQPDEPGESLGD